MATQDKTELDQQAFADSFNEPDAAAPEQTEDESFGITPEVSADTDPQGGEAPAVAIDAPMEEGTPAEPEAPQDESGETPAEEAMETPAEEGAELPAEEGSAPMTEQQLKSWEGRLKKQQAEQDSKGAGDVAGDDVQEVAEVAQAVESGEMSADEAIQKLSDDFGPEFVSMIQAIANKAAGDTASNAVGEVSQNVESIINHITDTNKRKHFEDIADAHPDFMEVHASPAFSTWLGSLPEAEQADSKQYLESGNAKQINGVLAAFKESTMQADASADKETNNAADDAEGVRSGGIQLPASPDSGNDSYEDAWKNA